MSEQTAEYVAVTEYTRDQRAEQATSLTKESYVEAEQSRKRQVAKVERRGGSVTSSKVLKRVIRTTIEVGEWEEMQK